MIFKVKQEKFEGPLELLLNLVEKEELAISEISLSKVTDDYIRYVRSLEKIDPEILAGFLVIAAELMLIKSSSLLPSLILSKEEELSIDELEERLQEYKRIQGLVKELKKIEQGRLQIFTREAYLGMNPVFYPSKKTTVEIIRGAFASFLEGLPKFEKLVEDKLRRIISLEGKISHIRNVLSETLEKSFSQIIKGAKEKVEIIVSFLAILELARERFVELEQKEPFQDIVVKKL